MKSRIFPAPDLISATTNGYNHRSTSMLSILLTKVSAQDMARYPDILRELDGVRDVSIIKRANAKAGGARE